MIRVTVFILSALRTFTAELNELGLKVNFKKFQVFGTTPDACDNKPDFPKQPFVITEPAEAAGVAEAEAAAQEARAAAKATPSKRPKKLRKLQMR